MIRGSERRVAVDAWESLYRAQVAVQRHLHERFPAGIAQSEYDVLYNLYSAPDRTARIHELHRHLLLTQPSVSRLVDRMVAKGLVAKCADQSDARGTLVRLTPAGEAVFRRTGAQLAAAIGDRMLGSLDAEDLERLRALCDALRGDDAPIRPSAAVETATA